MEETETGGGGKKFRPGIRHYPDHGACDVKLKVIEVTLPVCVYLIVIEVIMQVTTGQETALAASDESSQTAKVKEESAGDGGTNGGPVMDVENNGADHNEPLATNPATPLKEASNAK